MQEWERILFPESYPHDREVLDSLPDIAVKSVIFNVFRVSLSDTTSILAIFDLVFGIRLEHALL